MTRLALLALLVLGGCTTSYTEKDPDGYREASCHARAYVAYCVINVKPGQVVVGNASPVVSAIGGAAGGVTLLSSGASLIPK